MSIGEFRLAMEMRRRTRRGSAASKRSSHRAPCSAWCDRRGCDGAIFQPGPWKRTAALLQPKERLRPADGPQLARRPGPKSADPARRLEDCPRNATALLAE